MSTIERMSLERRWKMFVQELQIRGRHDTFSLINIGVQITDTYNIGNQNNKIHYVCLISS